MLQVNNIAQNYNSVTFKGGNPINGHGSELRKFYSENIKMNPVDLDLKLEKKSFIARMISGLNQYLTIVRHNLREKILQERIVKNTQLTQEDALNDGIRLYKLNKLMGSHNKK